MDFIEEAVAAASEKGQKIIVRFPPEPNGYMHIGHAKAFGISHNMRTKYNGAANLRFDDTNPSKENMHYVENIKRDIAWLGITYDNVFFASDYYEKLYEFAVFLIKKGLAYVDDSTADDIKTMRGDLQTDGVESPYRNRTVDENMNLFVKMRLGDFPDGTHVLRAKIDMKSPNMNMRDPVMYRINREEHYRTGKQWVIYPMYDFAHCLSDYLEHISHSLCSLEFEDHRPLYDWFVQNCEGCFPNLPDVPPHQYEFSRLNIDRFCMSKRWLKRFVDEGMVSGWDDPRMPTISGLRRRGYPPEAIMEFTRSVGVTKINSVVPISALEYYVRTALDPVATRVHAVESPIRVVITNYNKTEKFPVSNNPHDETAGTHEIDFSNEIYIDGDDFSANPPPKYKRLTVGGVVQLRGAYKIKCIRQHDDGHLECEITEDKAKGVIQFVDGATGVRAVAHELEPLLKSGVDITEENINRDGLHVRECMVERWLSARADTNAKYQFVRKGFYKYDRTENGKQIYLKTVGLKESF